MSSPCERVRESTARVVSNLSLLRVDTAATSALATKLAASWAAGAAAGGAGADVDAAASAAWGESGWHYTVADAARAGDPALLCQYVLVLSAVNRCFWPSSSGLEYEDVARGLARVLRADAAAFDAGALSRVSADTVRAWLSPHDVPDADGRAAALREVGAALDGSFGGRAAALVAAAGGSAQALVGLVLAHLPAFRDEAAHAAGAVCFYKRAQIFAADVWAAHGAHTRAGASAAAFGDVAALTCFADYRLPQLLRAEGVLVYAPALAAAVDARAELPAGGAAEVEIRAATVQVVEALRAAVQKACPSCQPPLAIHIDWMLWSLGETARDTLPPHHRTRTIFY